MSKARRSARRRLPCSVPAALTVAVARSLIAGLAAAAPRPTPTGRTTHVVGQGAPRSVPPPDRPAVLGAGWDNSADRAVTSNGDASGFHVLLTDAKDAYTWRTSATLT